MSRISVAAAIIVGSLPSAIHAQDNKPEVFVQLGHSGEVRSLAYSPDGRLALSGSEDYTLKLWEVSSGREIRTFKGHTGTVSSVAFSPDGSRVLSGSYDHSLKLWEVSSGREIRTFRGHSGEVRSLAYSPDGRYVLSGDFDGIINLWEVSSGREIRTFQGHTSWVFSVAFSPDGRYALSGRGVTLKLWDISPWTMPEEVPQLVVTLRSTSDEPPPPLAKATPPPRPAKKQTAKADRTPPTIRITAPAITRGVKKVQREKTVLVQGRASDASGIFEVLVNGQKAQLETDGSFQAEVALKVGDNRISVKATDRRGNAASTAFTVTRRPAVVADTTPPSIEITYPVITRGMKPRPESSIIVEGKATDPSGIAQVLVDGKEAHVMANGDFWAKVELEAGENRIVVEATDRHKNAAFTAFTVFRETGAAAAPPVVATRPRQQEEFQFGQYHALLIAVEDYNDRSINDLDYPIQDAERLRAVLLEQYTFKRENIHFLKNPTRRDILKQLGELRGLDEGDNLLIYYAGHDYWDEQAEQGYWLPRDARQDDDTDWISNSDIKDRIRSIATRHTLLISDAWFSGGIFKTREAFIKPDISIQKVYEMPSRKALTSGNLKTVPDKSVFVDYLVKRLKQNREPYLYSEKLYVNMRDAVTNNSPNNQTPLFGVINGAGDEGGDFIFVRKR